MMSDPTCDGPLGSLALLQCSVSLPKSGLHGLTARVKTLDRAGATVGLPVEDLDHKTVAAGECIELSLRLPQNQRFGPRRLSVIGNVVRVTSDFRGALWLVVRFNSLHFRGVAAERLGEDAASSRGDNARGFVPAGEDGAEIPAPKRGVK